MRADIRTLLTPEWVAAALIGVVAIAVLASRTVASPPAVVPSASVTASVRPTTSPTMDPIVRNALLSALVVNKRLAGQGSDLESVLDGDPVGSDIADILRPMNTDVLAGQPAAERLIGSAATAVLSARISRPCTTRSSPGTRRPSASRSERRRAYVDRARALVKRFADLPAIDARIGDALAGRVPNTAGSGPPSGASPSATAGATGTATAAPTKTPKPTQAPSATPVPSGSPPPSFDAGLVPNGTFDTGLAGWSLELAPEARATASHDATGGPDGSGAARIAIVEGTAARAGIAWTMPGLHLVPGVSYRVTASMRSSAPREVRVRLADGDGQTTTARVFQVDGGVVGRDLRRHPARGRDLGTARVRHGSWRCGRLDRRRRDRRGPWLTVVAIARGGRRDQPGRPERRERCHAACAASPSSGPTAGVKPKAARAFVVSAEVRR